MGDASSKHNFKSNGERDSACSLLNLAILNCACIVSRTSNLRVELRYTTR
jgi:hypothetical protein